MQAWSHGLGEDRISMARMARFYISKHHFNGLKSYKITPTGFTNNDLVLCHIFLKNQQLLPKT